MTSALQQRYHKALSHCVLFHVEDWSVILLSGRDVRDYLNRISTADFRTMQKGEARQTLFLNSDGRLVADCIAVTQDAENWLIVVAEANREALLQQIDRFLFSEDVKVSDAPSGFFVGLGAGDRIESFTTYLEGLDTGSGGWNVSLAPGIPRRLFCWERNWFQSHKREIYEWLSGSECVVGDEDLYEVLRIEAGIPVVGSELSDRTIPLEANLESAISFTKGCYPGQEIIARIKHLGHPANCLVALALPETSDPLVGSELTANGKVVGRITSAVYSPALKGMLGMGYVKWGYRETGMLLGVKNHDQYQVHVVDFPVRGGNV